jgi:hypothetical protein
MSATTENKKRKLTKKSDDTATKKKKSDDTVTKKKKVHFALKNGETETPKMV